MRGIRQHYKYDCGAACLASIASFYGIKASLAHLRMVCGCSPEGISIQGIIDGAASIGLKAKGYKSEGKELQPLENIGAPVIAHIKDDSDYYHFVVIYGIGNEKLHIMDPATGKIKKIHRKEFTESWTGYIIAVVPEIAAGKAEKGKSFFLNHLLALLKSFYKEIFLAFAGSLACTFAGISTTFLLQQLIDGIVPNGNHTAMAALGIIVFLLTVLTLYAGWCATRYLIQCSLKMETALLAGYMEKILHLPADFFGNYQAGDISSRRDDILNIRSFITEGTIGILTSVMTLAGALTAMFAYNHKLTLYISLFIPAYYGLYRLSGHLSEKYSREIASANSALEANLLEGIAGITGIRHYRAYPLAAGKMERSLVALMERLGKSANVANLFETLVQGVSKGMVCLILTIGAATVLHGEMTIGELVGFYTLCSYFTVPLNNLIQTSETIARTSVSFERIFEIMELPDESSSGSGISPESLSGNIVLHSVGFRFPGREELLKDVSFTIPEGKITLIQGESGCGKSTIAQLILRDLSPGSGKITYGNMDITQLDLQKWRDMIGYVPQDTRLFNATILDNITLGEENPDMERVSRICGALGMGGMMQRFPQGLLTPAGSTGSGLSGGECQRISIARALYKDPQIYIFDEMTSSLDPAGEQHVLQVTSRLRDAGKTVVFISHKEMSRSIADNVVTIN